MKAIHDTLKKRLLLNSILIIPFLFISCTSYNFSTPQPSDQDNLYQFPDEFLGKWKDKDSVITYEFEMTLPLNDRGGSLFNPEETNKNKISFGNEFADSDFYCIYKEYMVWVHVENKKIIKGAWPKLDDKKEFVYQAKDYATMAKIIYDSLKNPVDTFINYIIRGNKIYEKDPEGFLDRGNNFTLAKDTIIIHKKDSAFLDLGKNAFLRKLTNNIYVLNIHNGILSMKDLENWWTLIILETTGNNSFTRWECSLQSTGISCMFYKRPPNYHDFYFDCRWNTTEMLRLFRGGYFEEAASMEKTR